MKYSIVISEKVKGLVDRMDWTTLIDHVCCPNFGGDSVPEKEYGAVFFHPAKHNSLKKRIEHYASACKIRPLVTTDMEAGPGNMITDGTRFPSLMACARCNNEELAYNMGMAAAIEGSEVGFNWSLAPCVDLVAEIENPIVSLRSAGSDPEAVIRTNRAYIRGMQENAMAATVKHFPGDGFSTYDQHLTTTVNPLSKKAWRAKSGRVFKELIDDGVMTIMPGHISLPAFDVPDEYLTLCPPATLSRRLMVDLLRNELGFAGMIVSDAVNMGGMVNFMNYYDACATFWENGGDCLLFPTMNKAFYEEMEKRLDHGMLRVETLRDRAARILGLKEQMGLLGESLPLPVKPDFALHRRWAKEVAFGAIEVVRDRAGILPFKLKKNASVLHLIISNSYAENKELFAYFTMALQNVAGDVRELIDPGPDAIFHDVYHGGYDLIVCSTGSQISYGISTARLHGPEARNMMKGWMRLGTPVVFINHFHPYIHLEFDAAMDTLINTYRSSCYSIDAVMEKLFVY